MDLILARKFVKICFATKYLCCTLMWWRCKSLKQHNYGFYSKKNRIRQNFSPVMRCARLEQLLLNANTGSLLIACHCIFFAKITPSVICRIFFSSCRCDLHRVGRVSHPWLCQVTHHIYANKKIVAYTSTVNCHSYLFAFKSVRTFYLLYFT
jgi:hypothetical protein